MSTPPRTAHRRARSAALAAAAVLAAASAAAPAQADSLSRGRPVTPPGTIVGGFSVATSPAGGRAALLYVADAGGGGGQMLLFARLGLGRNLGPVRRLEDRRSDAGRWRVKVFSSRVAVGSDNTAVAAWVARGREAGRDQLRVALAPRGRGFGPARTLARVRGRSGYVPEVTVTGLVASPHGRIVVAWSINRPGKPSMHAAIRRRGAGFGAPQRLGTIGFASSAPPALALSPSGAVVAAWMLRGAQDASVRAATLRPGARRFGAARLISGMDDADDVGVFSGPGGAAVTWSGGRPANGGLMPLRIARLRGDGTLAARQTLALVQPGIQQLEVDGLQLGFPLAGPVAAWQVFHDISEAGDGNKNRTRIDTMIGRGANVFHAPQTRTAAGAETGLPVVGALADRMLLAWPERVAPNPSWHLRLAAHPSGGDWGPTRTFADIDGAIAIAASRRSALVLWQPFEPRAEQRVLQLAVYRP